MSEALNTPVMQIDSGQVAGLKIRHLHQDDLSSLEWEGEFKRFRKVYRLVFERVKNGLAVMWGAELPGVGLIGQAFVQLKPATPGKHLKRAMKAYIHSLRVRPAYRQAGVGSKIMQVLEDDLLRRGFTQVSLNVSRNNLAARRLYSRRGYSIIKSVSGIWSYYDHLGILRNVHEPGWRMEKKLG
ncbi:MAG: GNAT family N-acetyltransferase [Chloroflexi bacterium]|nr:GNAT family N-acetyltransferase [Chloroflexota bacterium]